MKIYFTASLTGKNIYEKNYRKIVGYLEEFGCKVFSKQVFNETKDQVVKKTKKERLAYSKLLNHNLNWCDIVVAEVSYPSTSIGYEICLAIHHKKPVLALYSDKEGDFPPMLFSLKGEAIMIVDYNLNNLKNILKNHLDFIEAESIKKRFTMLLTPKITKLLDRMSKKEQINRSAYIRKLIEADVKRKK